MRTLVIAAIVAAMTFGGTAAEAQRIGTRGGQNGGWIQPAPQPQPMPAPGGWNGQPRPNPQPMPPQTRPPRPGNPGQWNGQPRPGNPGQWNGQPRPGNGGWTGGQNNGQWRGGGYRGGSRWGGSVGGYWYAGVQAPGGWNGYKHIKRGKTLPRYWVSANFLINDWQAYGLFAPQPGYYWTRYYNDALLIDRYGVVYDSRDGIDWDGAYAGNDGYYAEGPGYGAGYPAPGYNGSSSYTYETSGGYAPPPPPMPAPAPRGPAYGGPIYAGPGSVTTITVPGAVTTTTTTEYIEETTYVAPKKVWRAPVKKWKPRPKPKPRCCPCGCR